MKNLLLFFLLVLSMPVSADWLEVTKTERATFYIDPSTIKEGADSPKGVLFSVGESAAEESAHLRKVLELHDYKQGNPGGNMSTRAWKEYDCDDSRARILSLSYHSESMGQGKTIFALNEWGRWFDVAPYTVESEMLDEVCAQ